MSPLLLLVRDGPRRATLRRSLILKNFGPNGNLPHPEACGAAPIRMFPQRPHQPMARLAPSAAGIDHALRLIPALRHRAPQVRLSSLGHLTGGRRGTSLRPRYRPCLHIRALPRPAAKQCSSIRAGLSQRHGQDVAPRSPTSTGAHVPLKTSVVASPTEPPQSCIRRQQSPSEDWQLRLMYGHVCRLRRRRSPRSLMRHSLRRHGRCMSACC
jgi:hypothetical protein